MSITPDAVRAEIAENANVVGNPVKTAAKLKALASYLMYSDSNSDLAASALAASKLLYVDSNVVPQAGNVPFALPVDVSGQSTTSAFLNLTGRSSLSGSADMTLTLVAGSAYTTFTKSGAIRVTITDSAGNVVDGDHYIQIGSLS